MADYYGMTSIDTAVVSDTGDLLIGLTDGNVINAGYVRGRPGPQGERGLMGPTGDPGRNGLDGAQLYTGLGKPADDMGVEGDLYIDIRSRFLDIYQKTGGTWLVISSLRDPSATQNKFQPGMGGAQGDGGGGGSNVIINNNIGGPTLDSEGNPIAPGMLWYNPDTGHLFVRSANNLEWIPIAGLPAAEFGPNPPDEDRGEHPIESGDLWFDSDQAALYVAVRNAVDQFVWVIALPADRTGVPDDQNPFVMPLAADGEIVTNPTTGIRYVYNAAKNQWIDIPTTGNNIFYQEDPPTLENANLGIGDVWVKESTKQIYVFNGLSWDEVRARPKVYTSDTAPSHPSVSNGELWWDSSDTELTLYVRYNDTWIPAAPPVSLDGINATIDAALLVQSDLVERVTAGEIAQTSLQGTVSDALNTQQEIQADILTLQQEIDALEDTRYVGTWNAIDDASLNGRPPGDGNFYFNQGALATDWSLVGWLYIANVDSNGVTFTHSDIEVGDQIEVISKTENSYGIYTIQDTTDAGDYIAIQIETLNRSDGTPAVGPHLIKIFSIDTGVDLDEADARYMKLRGNQQLDKDVTFRLRQNDSADANKTFVAINDGEMNLYHVADPSADTHAANQKYVKEQRDTRLALTGGTMTGELKIDRPSAYNHLLIKNGGTNAFKVGNFNDEVRLTVYNGQVFKVVGYVDDSVTQLFGVSNTGTVTLSNLRTPSADRDAVTKSYLEEQIAAVDAGVQETDRIIPKPSRWKYMKNETLAENLNRGEFLFKKDNGEVFKIYLSQYNEFGEKWGATSSEFDWYFNQRMIISITDYDGGIKYMAKIDKIAFNVGNNKYTRIEAQLPKMHMEPFDGSRYLINIPGLLPTWRFEPFREYGTPT